MSYEGYTEYLCTKGHAASVDAMVISYGDGAPARCQCGAEWEFVHDVDTTNGYDEDDPSTSSAGTVVIGHEDTWHRDHYGNRYATMTHLHGPEEGSAWERVSDRKEKYEAEIAKFNASRRWYIQASPTAPEDGADGWDFIYSRTSDGLDAKMVPWREVDFSKIPMVKTKEEAEQLLATVSRLWPTYDCRISMHILSDEEMNNAAQDG